MGDAAWTVELGPDIDIDVNARCMGLAASIADAVASGELGGVVDIVPTFRSVTVHFDPRHSSAPTIPSHLQALARAATPPTAAKRTWRLPACFDSRYAPDLQAVADRHNLSPEAVIAQFLSTPLRVYAMGFMPGFAYMARFQRGSLAHV
jgi:allophanate hydrolase subunit 1